MDAANCALATGLVSKSYVSQGQQALAQRQRRVKALLSSRRLPEDGWDDATIEAFLQVGLPGRLSRSHGYRGVLTSIAQGGAFIVPPDCLWRQMSCWKRRIFARDNWYGMTGFMLRSLHCSAPCSNTV